MQTTYAARAAPRDAEGDPLDAQLGGLIASYSTKSTDIQIAFIVRRFGLSPTSARLIAGIAFVAKPEATR